MSEWRSMESAPKNKHVLLWDGKSINIARWTKHWISRPWLPEGYWWIKVDGDEGAGYVDDPVYWMELPPPPRQNYYVAYANQHYAANK